MSFLLSMRRRMVASAVAFALGALGCAGETAECTPSRLYSIWACSGAVGRASCTMPVWNGATPRDVDPAVLIDSVIVALPVGTPRPPDDFVEFFDESGELPVVAPATFVESSAIGLGLGAACEFAVLRYELGPAFPGRALLVHRLARAPMGLTSVDGAAEAGTFGGEPAVLSTLVLSRDAGP